MFNQKSSSIIRAFTEILGFKVFLHHLNFWFGWEGKNVNSCKISLIFV